MNHPSNIVREGDLHIPLDARLANIERKQGWVIVTLVVVLVMQVTDNGKVLYDLVTALGAAVR